MLGSGGIPHATSTTINFTTASYRYVKVSVAGPYHWSGIYEVEVRNAAAAADILQTQDASGAIVARVGADGTTTFNSSNVGIGTTAPQARLHVVGQTRLGGDVVVDGNIAAKYQDVAEWVESREANKLTPGTVVVLDAAHSNQVLASRTAYDTRVAGVVSDRPGLILGEGGANRVKVATTGRVKVRAAAGSEAIKIGDLLVTSDQSGAAMRSEPVVVGKRAMHLPGTIIGKALEQLAAGKTGEILVLLSLQ